MLQMEESKRVADYFSCVLSLTNAMKGCSEQITNQMIIDKIMCTQTQNFDHIVVAIEESKDVETMKIEELQGSLEAQELMLIQRSKVKVA